MTTAEIPRTISASIHRSAISRVPDFFNATIADIFTELLQNSRRAGASRVDVTWDGSSLTLTDDGCGIADPAVLLAFGESSWEDGRIGAEHPAGMGIYSLARHPVRIESKPAGGPGWAIALEQDHCTGRKAAPVSPADRGSAGTTVTLDWHTDPKDALQNACRFLPIPVSWNGEQLQRASLTGGAVATEDWQGLRLSVHRNTGRTPRLNFHGVLLHTDRLPTVPDLYSRWIAEADVRHCPELRLTLPARKELVETPFLDEMAVAAYRAIYRAMRDQSSQVDVPHAVQQHAASLGITLPDARRRLRPWQAEHADYNAYEPLREYQQLPHSPLVMACELPVADQTALDHRAEGTDLQERLFEGSADLAGYGWYQALTKITGMSIHAQYGAETHSITGRKRSGREREALPSQRPDAITITLHCENPFRGRHDLQLDTDLAFVPDSADEYIDGRTPVVTVGSGMTAGTVCEYLEQAYFEPSDDAGADAYDTQAEDFRTDALRVARRLLQPPDEATVNALGAAIHEVVRRELPRGTNATVVIRHPAEIHAETTIEITLHEPPENPASSGPPAAEGQDL